MQTILESVLLRREKNMRDADGKQIVELPPKEVVVEELLFSAMERKIYDSIFSTVKKDFDRLNAKGLVSQNYTHILAMLMKCVDWLIVASLFRRLRLPCCAQAASRGAAPEPRRCRGGRGCQRPGRQRRDERRRHDQAICGRWRRRRRDQGVRRERACTPIRGGL